MNLQLKAVLLIAMLAGYEANRIKAQVGKAKLINRMTDFSQKSMQDFAAETEFGERACDVDVIVEAAGDQKLDVRLQKAAIKAGVEVGRKTKNGCDVIYSLLCQDNLTTLQKEVAPCEEQTSDCEDCSADWVRRTVRHGVVYPSGFWKAEQDHFSFWKAWRSTHQHKGQSLFKFSDDFNSEYAEGALVDSRTVHFTPTGDTCADARAKIASKQATLEEALVGLENVEDKGSFKARIAMMKPFQKAKMGYDKMGCENTPIMEESFLNEMVGKLRATFVSVRQPDVNEETAQKRFHDTLAFIKGHSTDISLKDAIEASGIALGKDVTTEKEQEDVDGSEDVDAEHEDRLEDALTEQSTALVQLQEGQVAVGGSKWGFVEDAVNGVLWLPLMVVIICLFTFFWHVAIWLFMVAVIISAGILAWAMIVKILK